MTSTILVAAAAALVAAVPGFFLSFRFYKSDHAAKDRSGEFFLPEGAFLALFGGTLFGAAMVFFIAPAFFPAEVVGAAFLTAIAAGLSSGVAGLVLGIRNRKMSDSVKRS